ncbi:hypothetical protein GCM10007086_38700 [Photobacterium aphoticum]|nr:hypothetical protein GCM10007086_38700 [Photobacterium aphoticum]
MITETMIPDTINQGSISIVSYPFVEQEEALLNDVYILLSMAWIQAETAVNTWKHLLDLIHICIFKRYKKAPRRVLFDEEM